jgi:hypothetical protein
MHEEQSVNQPGSQADIYNQRMGPVVGLQKSMLSHKGGGAIKITFNLESTLIAATSHHRPALI